VKAAEECGRGCPNTKKESDNRNRMQDIVQACAVRVGERDRDKAFEQHKTGRREEGGQSRPILSQARRTHYTAICSKGTKEEQILKQRNRKGKESKK